MYFFAKIELSKFQYGEAMEELKAADGQHTAIQTCEQMKAYVKGLLAEFGTVPPGAITKKTHEQLEFTMHTMAKYADLGIAESMFRGNSGDRFAEVVKATNDVVGEMLTAAKNTPADQPIKRKDYKVTASILGLALRANVQKGDTDKGLAILKVLQRLKGEEPDAASAGNVVADLLSDIAGQIRALKETKDAKALQETKGKYSAFLDVIAKEFETGKGADNNSSMMLAHAYMSLDFPAKAAASFAKVTPPADLDKKNVKLKNETPAQAEARQKWEEDLSRYWSGQIEYIRALRACKDKDAIKTAASVADTLLKHPNGKFQLQTMMEKNLILEDQQQYRVAYAEWQKFLKIPSISGPNLVKKDVQMVFFPGYWHSVRCGFKLAILDPGIKEAQRPTIITNVTKMLINLENAKGGEGWGIVEPMMNEYFLDPEAAPLKKEYERQKALRSK